MHSSITIHLLSTSGRKTEWPLHKDQTSLTFLLSRQIKAEKNISFLKMTWHITFKNRHQLFLYFLECVVSLVGCSQDPSLQLRFPFMRAVVWKSLLIFYPLWIIPSHINEFVMFKWVVSNIYLISTTCLSRGI